MVGICNNCQAIRLAVSLLARSCNAFVCIHIYLSLSIIDAPINCAIGKMVQLISQSSLNLGSENRYRLQACHANYDEAA